MKFYLEEFYFVFVHVRIFVFQFVIQKCKDRDVQNCNFTASFVWLWNLVAHIEGITSDEGFRE
jgi:hypothetical protein